LGKRAGADEKKTNCAPVIGGKPNEKENKKDSFNASLGRRNNGLRGEVPGKKAKKKVGGGKRKK